MQKLSKKVKTKKGVALLLTAVMFLALIPAGMFTLTASAQDIDWEADSITITTEAQLRELANRVNGLGGFEGSSFEGQTFVLANDITVTGGNWMPIGRNAAVSDAGPWTHFSFDGTFDGNGKVVSNLIISGNIYFAGFFGVVGEKGHIKNLGVNVVECDISKSWGNANAGGIAGSSAGTIEKCFATGDIKAGTTWNAYVFVGGLVGINQGIINECYATGNVNAFAPSRVYVGGLVGTTWGDSKILDGAAAITNSYATGDVSVGNNSGLYMGGLVGDNGYSVTTTIVENCYSTGNVSGSGGDVGGLAGRNAGSVTASYYNSETSGKSDTGKGEPKTAAQMKSQATFEDWNFGDVWGIASGTNAGYPYLLRIAVIPSTPQPTSSGASASATPQPSGSQTVTPQPTGSANPVTYTVIFKDGNKVIGEPQIVEHGKAATAPDNPSKKGHKFNGWDKKFDNVTQDLTINAKWKANTYKITWKLNKGKLAAKNKIKSYTYGKNIKFKKPTRKNHKFGGWYTDKKLTKKISSTGKTRTGNLTLYAKWTKKK